MFILHLLQKLTEPFSLLDKEEQRQLIRCLTSATQPLEKLAEPGNSQHTWRADFSTILKPSKRLSFLWYFLRRFSLRITLTSAELFRRKARLPSCLSLGALLELSSDSSLTAFWLSVLLPQWQHLRMFAVSSISLYSLLLFIFLDVFRIKDKINFCKAYCHLSTVSLSAKECPLYLSHADTWSRLASRKCCVFTLESEKTYSFRCVFSFSVSSTMTSLLGTFWDLMSCKTIQRLSVMSYNHQN